MNTPPSNRLTDAQAQALEARFALRLTSRLHDGAAALPHDITERLRVARQQAVAAAAQARLGAQMQPVAAPPALVAGSVLVGAAAGHAQPGLIPTPGLSHGLAGQTARHAREPHTGKRLADAPTPWGWRLASALPALALVAGLWLIEAWHQREQVQAASEVDMALLTDELPPAAYADPGFEEFLRSADSADPTTGPTEQQARPEPTDLLPEIDTGPAENEAAGLGGEALQGERTRAPQP